MVETPAMYVEQGSNEYEWKVVRERDRRVVAVLGSQMEAAAFMDGYQEGVVDAKTGDV